MLDKEKITQWLIKNCTNEYGDIDLSKLNFDKSNVLLNGIKTKGKIYNYNQVAYDIDNFGQKAKHKIDNGG